MENSVKTCRYPLWGTERPTHKFCSKPLGDYIAPYCKKHYNLCYDKKATDRSNSRMEIKPKEIKIVIKKSKPKVSGLNPEIFSIVIEVD